MTHVLSLTPSTTRNQRFVGIVAGLGHKHADRRDRVKARRTALAMSAEARINAHMRYRRLRYRHMAS